MAIGEKVIFDIGRFMLPFNTPDAIGIVCENQDQLNETIEILKGYPILKFHSTFNHHADRYVEDIHGWAVVYCTSSNEVCFTTARDSNETLFSSDYNFVDITFPDRTTINIDIDSLIDVLNK